MEDFFVLGFTLRHTFGRYRTICPPPAETSATDAASNRLCSHICASKPRRSTSGVTSEDMLLGLIPQR